MVKTKHQRGSISSDLAVALSELASSGNQIFTIEEFAQALNRPKKSTWRVLNSLLSNGWIIRLIRGKYLIVPLEAGPESTWSLDSYVIAGHLAVPYSLAYWTACHYWNWTEQVPRVVFLQTTQKTMKNTRTIQGITYRIVRVRPSKFFGTTKRWVGDAQVVITDQEKTFVDLLDHPELCGGFRQVLEMVPLAKTINWDKVEKYLKQLGTGAVYKRLGFLIELHGRNLTVPKRHQRLRRWRTLLTGGYAPLEPEGPKSGKMNSRWQIRINVPGLS